MRSTLALLSLVASAFAISVTQPSATQGWTLGTQNTVSWSSVSTDRANFTILLVNQRTTPAVSQILTALQDTSDGSTTVSLPNSVTAGSGYRVNLVQDAQNLNTILAQSSEFNITTGSSSSSAATSTRSTGTTAATPSSSRASATLPGVGSSPSPSGNSTTSGSSRMAVDGFALLGLASLGAILL